MPTGSMSEILTLMPFNVNLETWTGVRDQYGELTYNTPVSIKAMWQGSSRMIRNQDGDEAVSNNQVWVYAPSVTITTNDRITLPDGSQPPIQAVDVFFDELGVKVAHVVYF